MSFIEFVLKPITYLTQNWGMKNAKTALHFCCMVIRRKTTDCEICTNYATHIKKAEISREQYRLDGNRISDNDNELYVFLQTFETS